jgi:peptidylprolyl isomerase
VACGSDSKESSSTGTGATATASADIPLVSLPTSTPTSLVITDVRTGTGAPAKDGDVLFVRYVGVRSANGEQFDQNFTTGDPLPVTLGAGGVIKGWDQGLVGVTQGGRRQLDIPPDLAYGDSPQGEVIQKGDALSFVIDVIGIAPLATAADQPKVDVTANGNIESMTTQDLVTGDGPVIADGQHVVVQITLLRADDASQLSTTYQAGQPFVFVMGQKEVIPGLEQTVTGMHVGGRREAQVPYADAFGDAGRPDSGLPEKTDVVLVVDLVNAF